MGINAVSTGRYPYVTFGIDPGNDGNAGDISAQDIYAAALSDGGIPKATRLLLAITKTDPGKMGPLLQEINNLYKNDPAGVKNVPQLIQAEMLRQICAQSPVAASTDLTRDGKTSALLLVTYPNGSHAGYHGGTVVDDLQDDLQRKKEIYGETYGITEENLVVVDAEQMSESEILALIDQEIQRAISSGQEEFLLEYTAHGICGGQIRLGNGTMGIMGTELAQVLDKYTDRIKITVVSHTCRGAWQLAQMQEVFAKNPNLKGVTVYTASDFNPETSQFTPEGQLFSSEHLSQNIDNPFDYYFSLAYEINPNVTYSQARLFASRLTQEQFATAPLCVAITPANSGEQSLPFDFPEEQKSFEAFLTTSPNRLSNLMNYQPEPTPYIPNEYVSQVVRVF